MSMLPEDDTRGSLERARERLYNPNATARKTEQQFSQNTRNTQHQWEETKKTKQHKHVRWALMFFWVAIFFFVVAAGYSAYLLFSGDRTVSVQNVPITIQGPTTIAGGDTVSFQITIENRNPAAIKDVTLALAFPPGTRAAASMLTPLTNDTENLGTIAPGGRVERTVRAVLFGGQGKTLTIKSTLQFKTNGSNAIFVAHKNYAISIISTPLSVSVTAPSAVISGQPFTIVATVRSNTTKSISGVVLRADYPIGFTPIRTSVQPAGNNFPLGTLVPGATSTVRITGKLTGWQGEQRAVRFTVGTAATAQGTTIAVAYMKQHIPITISQPFLATTLSMNGGSLNNAVLAPGAVANIKVNWTNTLSVPVVNAQVSVVLSGNAFDPASVQVSQGQYQSADQTVVFSRDTNPALAVLAPGAQGSYTFSFAVLPSENTGSTTARSPSVALSVDVSGQYAGQGNTTQTGNVSISKTIKVTTALALGAYALRTTGSFSNTGPIPPMPNRPTTYTIVWTAHNTTNDVAAANITANLPTEVKFLGAASADNGTVTYNTGAHTVTWAIGDLAAGATRRVAFQVSFTPSTGQIGTAPQLVAPGTFSGFDRYAQVSISQVVPAVTTSLINDPAYQAQPSAGTVR